MGVWVGKGKDKKVLCVSEYAYLVFKICGFTCSHKKEHRDIWWNLYTWHTFCVMLVSYDVRHCCQGFSPPSHILTQNMEIINTAKSTTWVRVLAWSPWVILRVSLFSAHLAPAESSFSLLWERQQPTPVSLSGESQGQRNLGGYIVHGVTKSRTWLKRLSTHARCSRRQNFLGSWKMVILWLIEQTTW